MRIHPIVALSLLTSLTVISSVFLLSTHHTSTQPSLMSRESHVAEHRNTSPEKARLRLHLFDRRYRGNITSDDRISTDSDWLRIKQCPELSSHHTARVPIHLEAVSTSKVEREQHGVRPGGTWSPQHCTSQQFVVIVIPYRKRATHLKLLLRHLHPFLQAQLLSYSFLVVEQVTPAIFNRGALLNIGFLEAKKMWPTLDCAIFHDVDLLPENTGNSYRCRDFPLHLGAFVNTANYSAYVTLVGGALAIRPNQMLLANGFSNSFWGWGGEDDDMYNRLVHYKHFKIYYPDKLKGRMTMIRHQRDKDNPTNPDSIKGRKVYGTNYSEDGLNSVRYQVSSLETNLLFTRIKVHIEMN